MLFERFPRFRRYMAVAAAAAVFAVSLATPLVPAPARNIAFAQMGNTSNFNCAMLSGTPFMCLKNESQAPIVAVQAVYPGGGWYSPSGWISIPGGGINPGCAAVVKFPVFTHGSIQNIVVRTMDGQIHYMWGVNVVANTSLTVRW